MTLSTLNTPTKLSTVFFFAMCLGGANCQPAPDRTLCSSDEQCGEGRVCNEETNRCEDADGGNNGTDGGNNGTDGGNNGTDGGNNGTDGGTDTEVSAEIAEQNEFIQLVSDDGATPWRFIGIKRNPSLACPQPTTGDFNGRELFAQDQGANDTLPPALRKFCLYESTLIEFDPAQPGVPAELQALTSPNLPDQLVSIEPDHMGLAGSSKLTTEYQRSFFNETKEHGGKLGFLPTDSNEPQRVRLAVLDSSPTADWNSGAQVVGRSMHGHGIANIARELTCDNSGQCMADISTQMAMPLYYEAGHLVQDPINGGDFGSIAWLAEAIFRETRAWKQSESHEHLVLNLSLGCPPEAGRSLRARGASPIAIALYGVLPQIRHQWVGYGLFRLECAIRSASIMGVVGAGGIGSEIDLSIRYFQYDKLGTALMAVLASVIALEVLSQFLRRRPLQWSLGLLSIGILGGFLSLRVRWSQLVSEHAVEQLFTFLSGFSNPTLELGWLWSAMASMLETLCMASCATALAALVAFGLAPLATTKISVTGYLERVGKTNPHQLALAKLVHGLSRLCCQVLRAIPELVWALIFVVWVGAGPMAGTIAIAAHTIGILGRLFGEVYDDIDPSLAKTMEHHGAGRFATWCYGVLPQAIKPVLAFTLFRLEVNIRATAMVGFVGAGGIGNEIHTAISLFHFHDLATLLAILVLTVACIDAISSSLRHRLLAQ